MKDAYQFEEFMASAREALGEGNADTAMDWLNKAMSLSKYLEEEEVAKAHRLKAQILIAEEELSEAEEALEKSLDIFWRSCEAHVLLGELMLLDGRYEGAASSFESALEIAPRNAQALSLLVFCCGLLGKPDAAKECFEKCIEVEPQLADGYYHMGISLIRDGKPGANELFETALAKDPVLSGPHYYLGRMAMAEGDFATAERELRRELELNPANSLAEFQLIRSYLLRAPWQEGVKVFDRHFPEEVFCEIPALRGCHFHYNYELFEEKFDPFIEALLTELPQTPKNIFHVARIYRHKSLFGEAIELLKKTMETERNFRPAYGELAEIYRTQGDAGRACEVLEEATAIFQDAEAYCDLVRAFISCGRHGEAEEAARKAVSLRPDLSEAHYLLGAILADAAGRTARSEEVMEEAHRSLLKALEINPQHAGARAYLMHIAFQAGKYAECVELAEKMLTENPEDRSALCYSGRCCHAAGNLSEAETRLRKLVERYPDDQPGRAALAEVYRAQGKFKEAAEELEQATSIPGRRPSPDLLLRLGEIYLLDLKEPSKAREHLLHFLRAAPPGHPGIERVTKLLGVSKASPDF